MQLEANDGSIALNARKSITVLSKAHSTSRVCVYVSTCVCPSEIAKHGMDAWDSIRFRRPTDQEISWAVSAAATGGRTRQPETILDCHYNHRKLPDVCVCVCVWVDCLCVRV